MTSTRNGMGSTASSCAKTYASRLIFDMLYGATGAAVARREIERSIAYCGG